MNTYLCVVSPQFPENYHIGVRTGKWGVEKRYRRRIADVEPGDELVFIASNAIRSIHHIESKPFVEDKLLWPPKNGDLFPYRILISPALFQGEISTTEFTRRISFMRDKRRWGGTIQGANGVFNSRLTAEDVAYIKSQLQPVADKRQAVAEARRATYTAENAKALFRFFEKDVLAALNRLLPALGLRRYNGKDFPEEYDLGYGGNVVLCIDVKTEDLVVVDFNRGEAPNETLLRLLHYMSWVRQNLSAGKRDVRGVILTEKAHESLNAIVREVPNVSIKCYRLGIELAEGVSA